MYKHELHHVCCFLQTLKDANIAAELFGNYPFFERVIETLLRRLRLIPEGPQVLPTTQIAVACEVRRLLF